MPIHESLKQPTAIQPQHPLRIDSLRSSCKTSGRLLVVKSPSCRNQWKHRRDRVSGWFSRAKWFFPAWDKTTHLVNPPTNPKKLTSEAQTPFPDEKDYTKTSHGPNPLNLYRGRCTVEAAPVQNATSVGLRKSPPKDDLPDGFSPFEQLLVRWSFLI